MTATVDPSKLTNLTIVSLAIEDCKPSDFSVKGNTVETSFEACGHSISQMSDVIVQVNIPDDFT